MIKTPIPSLIIAIAVTLSAASFVNAQANKPQFIVNWKSNVFVPSFYQGKSLAVNLAPVSVGFELVKNGSLVNLANYDIRWLANGGQIASGRGLQLVKFTANAVEDMVMTIIIKDFNGGNLEETFIIPLISPQSVLERRAGLLYAWPYFFNTKTISDLAFSWQVNGQKTSGQVRTPHILELSIFPTNESFPITASVIIQNNLNLLERSQSIKIYE